MSRQLPEGISIRVAWPEGIEFAVNDPTHLVLLKGAALALAPIQYPDTKVTAHVLYFGVGEIDGDHEVVLEVRS